MYILFLFITKSILVMHQSILALPIPPPGQPPGICTFFFFKLTIPGGRAGKAWQCPAPGQKKDDKCPAPGHTDSFIECILDLQTSITLLASLIAQGAQALICISVVCFSVYLFYECLYIAF